jgi:hypothetical protein
MYAVVGFQIRLSYATWYPVKGDDGNKIFNFCNTYLIIVISSFPFTTVKKDNC